MLTNCKFVDQFNIVLLFHQEHPKAFEVINLYHFKHRHIISVDGLHKTPLENMNNNRLVLLKYCFENLASKYVISIEDDVLLAYDSLSFSDFIINKYAKKYFFRGINLGSMEPKNTTDNNSYGLFRYGLSGQGGVITIRMWKKIINLNLLKNLSVEGFDSMVEAYWKTGFVVAPYASRYIDIGWRGTHAPKDSSNWYYKKLRKSWLGPSKNYIKQYIKRDRQYLWRSDCIKYNCLHNPYYFLKFLKNKFI
jgi:hypothetical protein